MEKLIQFSFICLSYKELLEKLVNLPHVSISLDA